MARRLAVVLLAAGLAALGTGCTTSGLRATDVVTVHGILQAEDGGPIGGRTIFLRKALSADELQGRMQQELSSVQLACVADHAPGACRRAHYAHLVTSGADGSFTLVLTGQDTQSALGLVASRIQVAASGPVPSGGFSGPATSAALRIQVTDLHLPILRLWGAVPDIQPAPEGARVSWPALPAEFGASPNYRVLFDDGAGGLVWDSGPLAGRTSYTVDARVLEDADGGVSVVATTDGSVVGSGVSLAYRTGRRHVKGSAGSPPSRGRPCTVTSGVGQVTSQTPCGLTDGRFDRPALVTAAAPGPSTTVCPVATTCARAEPLDTATVDLGRPVDGSLAVLRGCPSGCVVAVSSDASTWATVGTAAGPDALMPLTSGAVRYLRVSGPSTTMAGVTELSIWPVQAAAGRADVRAIGGTPASRHTSRRVGVYVVVAGLLLIVLVGALGFVLGRRPAANGRRL